MGDGSTSFSSDFWCSPGDSMGVDSSYWCKPHFLVHPNSPAPDTTLHCQQDHHLKFRVCGALIVCLINVDWAFSLSPASVAVQDWSLSIRILFLAIAEALPLTLHRPTTTRASESHPLHIHISSKWLTQSTNYCIQGFPTSLMKSAMDRNRPRNGYSDVNWQFAMEQHHVQ